MNSVYTVLIGGKAGEGVKKAAQVLANQLLRHGLYVYQQDDYQSLIKGGHNFSNVSYGQNPVYCAYQQAQLVISFDKRSYELHARDLDHGGFCYHAYNSDEVEVVATQALGFPMSTLMKQIYVTPANVSMAALSIAFAWFGWDAELLNDTIYKEFKRDQELNSKYALAIYELACQSDLHNRGKLSLDNASSPSPRFLSGNQAIALGAWSAGLDFYYAYPMTPASSILHYLALKQNTHKVFAIHAESELAAANMAIGSALTGAKSAVGSSGGGFALMQEAFSLAAMAEVPLLFILVSRPGPATGVSTYTAQEDLLFAIHQGHGDLGKIVAAPDSPESAFRIAAELLSLAWEFQNPVILLSDKHLSESSMNIVTEPVLPASDEHSPQTDQANYLRYEFSADGVSPLAALGQDDKVIKWTSHEHLESGIRTDKAADIVAMKDKRNRKYTSMYAATERYPRIAVYGDKGTPVFAYGSTVLELREAQKHCPVPFHIVSLLYLYPFPDKELQAYAAETIITVEHSSNANLSTYLKQNMNLKIKRSILRYDGRPYDPFELAKIMEEALNA